MLVDPEGDVGSHSHFTTVHFLDPFLRKMGRRQLTQESCHDAKEKCLANKPINDIRILDRPNLVSGKSPFFAFIQQGKLAALIRNVTLTISSNVILSRYLITEICYSHAEFARISIEHEVLRFIFSQSTDRAKSNYLG